VICAEVVLIAKGFMSANRFIQKGLKKKFKTMFVRQKEE
jgi:hypothetical protein